MPSRPTPSRPPRSSERRPRDQPGADRPISGKLNDQLCFALYAASNAIQRAYTPHLKARGLTYVQYLVLLVLWEQGDCSVGDIGRRLFLDSGTLTPVLRRLERQGLLVRQRAETDERKVRITLLSAGTQLESELAAVRAEVACRAALEPAAFCKLRDELHDLRAHLTRAPNTLVPVRATENGDLPLNIKQPRTETL